MSTESRLQELNITVPTLPEPKGNYVPALRVGDLLYLSGAICLSGGAMSHTGKVGETQTLETAQEAARVCALNLLAAIRSATGTLDAVEQVVRLDGFVNAQPGFADSPTVINGASDFMVAVFGDAGKHTRTAVGVTGLPLDSTVEIAAVVKLKP